MTDTFPAIMQDEILRRAVSYYGAKNWKKIGEPVILSVASQLVSASVSSLLGELAPIVRWLHVGWVLLYFSIQIVLAQLEV